MIGPLSLFLIFQFVLSSFLAFGAAALAVQIILSLFRVKSGRIRSLLRGIPFLYICFDVRIGDWLNPLSCLSCLQKLLIYFFPLNLQEQLKERSIAEWASPLIPPLFLQGLFILFTAVTFGRILKTLFQIVQETRWLNKVLASATIHTKHKDVRLSDKIQTPLAAKERFIVIPSSLNLSDAELDAVIAHERDHLRWKDSYVRIFYALISAFFWWIPMKNWLKKLEEDQEDGCDRQALYPIHLAEAILKTTASMKQKSRQSFCCLASKPHASLRRMHTILKGPQIKTSWVSYIVGALLGMLVALSCVI